MGIGRIGSTIAAVVVYTFTPVPNGDGANPEASNWWHEHQRQGLEAALEQSFMEDDNPEASAASTGSYVDYVARLEREAKKGI